MKVRALAATASFALLSSVGGIGALAVATAPAASAAAAPAVAPTSATSGLSTQIPCSVGGVANTCSLTVTSLQLVNGALQAAGTVTSGGVTIPFSGVPVTSPSSSTACPVLALTLGPLHLNLLGLVVDLNQVVLNITAQPGAGQLLGNLLCSVTHLLDNGAGTAGLNGLLNEVNTILGQL